MTSKIIVADIPLHLLQQEPWTVTCHRMVSTTMQQRLRSTVSKKTKKEKIKKGDQPFKKQPFLSLLFRSLRFSV
jgi:hypothetical protein